MRKAGGPRKRQAGSIRWDEQNLEENEAIKATISKAKINEPKTPYHGPLGDQHMEDADDGLQPLQLDSHNHALLDGAPSSSASDGGTLSAAAAPPVSAAAQLAGGESMGSGSETSSDQARLHGHGHPHAQGLHAHFDASLQSVDASAEPESRSGFSSDSELRASLTGGSDGEGNEDVARRKFQQRRRAHYNMREALRRARVLLSEDGEGNPDAEKAVADKDGEDGGDGAASSAVADTTMGDVGVQADKADS